MCLPDHNGIRDGACSTTVDTQYYENNINDIGFIYVGF